MGRRPSSSAVLVATASARPVLRDGGRGAGEARALAGHRHQGVQAEGLVRRERREGGRAAEVADERAVRDGGRRGGDLGVGDGQQDDVDGAQAGLAAQRPAHVHAGVAQARGERGAHSPAAHDRAAQQEGFGLHDLGPAPWRDAGRDWLKCVSRWCSVRGPSQIAR